MILYVLCYCFRKKKKTQPKAKEYRTNERASLVSGVQSTNPTSKAFIGTNRNAYQTIDGQNYIVRGSPKGGQPSLYQNVTESARAESTLCDHSDTPQRPPNAPPAYEQLT